MASLPMLQALMGGVCLPGMAPYGRASAAATSLSSVVTQHAVVGSPVKVYFSKFPQSLNRFTAVFPVARISPPRDRETFAIQLLIAGPTPTERRAGYFSELNSLLTGPSACSAPQPTGGPDFTLHLDRRGSTPERGTATLRFCRVLSSPGVGADARVRAEIAATLTQFGRIKKVVILTEGGHCFADESGADRCLH